MLSVEKISANFLEIASEQRLNILLNLNEDKITISKMAKKLDATVPEVHRNFTRLKKSGLIIKNNEGDFELTTLGKTMIRQIPAINFVSKNEKYFKNHSLDKLDRRFVHSIGSLSNSEMISGFVKVSEKWKQVYNNAEKYIYNILLEASYSSDLMEIIEKKLNKKITINSIFSDSTIVTSERKSSITKINVNKFIENGTLTRKMKKDMKIALIMNEKTAGICFPTEEQEGDLSKMIYSSDSEFHNWCYDYFKQIWKQAGSFQETKLKN